MEGIVYYMISYDIKNIQEFEKYPPLAMEIITKYGGKVLVSDTEAIEMEGKAKHMNALVEFPSKEAALNCYQDPAYEKIKGLRIDSTYNCTIVLAKKLEL